MKKITLEINGAINNGEAKKISAALNDLSGIVAADVNIAEGMASAYCGDQLQVFSASDAVRNAGCGCRVLKEEYITDAENS